MHPNVFLRFNYLMLWSFSRPVILAFFTSCFFHVSTDAFKCVAFCKRVTFKHQANTGTDASQPEHGHEMKRRRTRATWLVQDM